MPPKKRWMWAGLLAIVIASVWGLIALSNRAAVHEKEALAAFSQSIVLAMPRHEVDRRCKQVTLHNYGWTYDPNLQQLGASVARVSSPLTFGARHWVVYFVFENDVVAAMLVRTEDWRRQKPKGSPQDRVRDARAPWLAEFAQN
jgi:hypothetical protein